jgi:hypothetical protein
MGNSKQGYSHQGVGGYARQMIFFESLSSPETPSPGPNDFAFRISKDPGGSVMRFDPQNGFLTTKSWQPICGNPRKSFQGDAVVSLERRGVA